MDESTKKLEQMLQSKLEENPPAMALDKEWLKLETSLDAKAFLSFRWNRFNIYYLASLAAAICMAGTALYISLKKPVYWAAHVQSNGYDTVYVNKIIHDTIFLNTKHKTKRENALNQMLTKSQSGNVLPAFPTLDSLNENSVSTEEHRVSNEPEKKPELKKPVVYQYKRDTIIKYDSIKVSIRELKKMQRNR